MIKHFTTIILLFFSPFIFAQSALDSTRMLYQSIFEYNIPGNALVDIVTYSNILEDYRGLESDSLSSTSSFRKVLLQLKSSSKNPDELPSLDSLSKIASYYRDHGHIPIAVIIHDYAQLNESFYENLFEFDSTNYQILFDSGVLSQLESKKAVTICVLGSISQSDSSFILPKELFFVNDSVDEIKIDFGQGQGLESISIGTPKLKNLHADAFEGLYKKTSVKMDFTLGASVYTSKTSAVIIKQSFPDYSFFVSESEIDDACEELTDLPYNEAKVSIRFGKAQASSKALKKPFILVEGFDFDSNPNDGHFGNINYTSIIQGLSVNELTGNLNHTNLRDMKYFSERIYNEDYDLIFVDFKDGSADLFKNGNTLIKVIQWVNENKVGNEELVIMGASMGGLLARYALVMMEKNNCNHCCKLYGTFDTPHKGANTPLSLQYAVDIMTDNNLDTEFAWRALNSTAAKQMLIYNIAEGAQGRRAEWQNWLNTNGQPLLPKRIALTNANPTGQGPFVEGSLLYHSCYKYAGAYIFDMVLYSGKPGKMATYLRLPRGKSKFAKYANSILGQDLEKWVYFPEDHQYYDHVSGGQAGWIAEANGIIASYLSQYKNNTCNETSMLNSGLSTFIPAFSSLDFTQNQLHPNLTSVFPVSPIDLRKQSSSLHPFHSIYYHSSRNSQFQDNQIHVLIDNAKDQNIDWIMNELKTVNTDLDNVLPLNSTLQSYNYNQACNYELAVPSLLITTNGKLQLNGYSKIKYGTSADPLPKNSGDLQLFRTHYCGSYITVENDGVLEIGDDNSTQNNKAIFRILNGSTLDLGTDGILKIHDGSELIIEEGATLIYRTSAQIALQGIDAKLLVRGKIIIDNNAEFKLEDVHPNQIGTLTLESTISNSGVLFDALGNNSTITIEGVSISHPIMYLASGPIIITNNIKSVKLKHCKIFSKEGSSLNIHAPLTMEFVHILGDELLQNSQGLITYGQANQRVNNSVFMNLSTGLELNGTYSSHHPDITNCTFNNCQDGIGIFNGNVRVLSSNFISCINGVAAISDDMISLSNCLFNQNYSAGYFTTATGLTLDIDQTTFKRNDLALSLDEYVIANLHCTNFIENAKAIKSLKANLIMSPINPFAFGQSGSNTFYYNIESIVGEGSFYLESGLNNFIKSSTNSNPFFDILIPSNSPCLYTPQSLNGTDNYWDPKPVGGNLANSNPILYNVQVMSFPHPVLGQISGNLLSKVNETCFSLPAGNNNQQDNPTPLASTEIQSNVAEFYIHVYPNPSSSEIKINVTSQTERTIKIGLYDTNGKFITEQFSKLGAGTTTVTLETMPIESGQYYVKIESDGLQQIEKILIIN